MLNSEQINQNWSQFIDYIDFYILDETRSKKLIAFYEKYKERLFLMPASSKLGHHSAFAGGYIYHVNKVIECALQLNDVWSRMGVDTSTYTKEELIFSAINHDLGKMGSSDIPNYIDQDSDWRRDNMGETYKMNPLLPFCPVQDRSLFLLQEYGIPYSFNEWLAIKTHDGLYSDSNKEYLMGYSPDQKPRTALPYILHQADLMAARIEFEQQYTIGSTKPKPKTFKKPGKLDSLNNKPFILP